ncbi:MlaC/ttg2D family ABC transporter substrate-binding protein [Marinomonas algicola]|jgi:phospholipid transport system substrate-binding protein|uniref:MlaC/ttg2D family ABC transporter substrate-binding protein n=1 Tax=Marinomonas algicola TaxID=2773454 RepID=UPI001748E12A|nr:ABC transporter substrate-binding protein [Marinomonas algicola]
MFNLVCRYAASFFMVFLCAHVYANEEARKTVINVVDQFNVEIVQDKLFLAKNRGELVKRVDAILSPVINFDDFSKKVMGKYYRRATAEQRQRFAIVTKDTLLDTYGGSLLEFDSSKIKVLPLGPQSGREVKVNVEFVTDAGSPIEIDFYMEPDTASSAWFLSNVVINDINFGLTFRKQFGIMVQSNKNNIDKAIDAWQRSLASKEG